MVVGHVLVVKQLNQSEQAAFFSKSNLPLQKWVLGLLWWAREYPVTAFAEEAEITDHRAIDIYQWLVERGVLNKAPQYPDHSRWSWSDCGDRRVSFSSQA